VCGVLANTLRYAIAASAALGVPCESRSSQKLLMGCLRSALEELPRPRRHDGIARTPHAALAQRAGAATVAAAAGTRMVGGGSSNAASAASNTGAIRPITARFILGRRDVYATRERVANCLNWPPSLEGACRWLVPALAGFASENRGEQSHSGQGQLRPGGDG